MSSERTALNSTCRRDRRMKRPSKLHQIELQVEQEGREWKRKRMQELIKQLAPDQGEVSPPQEVASDQAAPDNAQTHDAQRADRDRDGLRD